MELADTSVWARKRHPGLRSWFRTAVEARQIAVCDAVALELLHTARNGDEFAGIEAALLATPWIQNDAADWRRVRDVYRMLAARGPAYHRRVGHADLLIAAAAERAGLTLVHYDRDYDTIAEVTGQPVRWVAPPGSLE